MFPHQTIKAFPKVFGYYGGSLLFKSGIRNRIWIEIILLVDLFGMEYGKGWALKIFHIFGSHYITFLVCFRSIIQGPPQK